ncbi:hypothetical protein PV328_009361 [Microctonus aethiopoides]|uniref:Uncharacterized protein n=1 Tax=Microctonus aethiopoides TaxID=144406 RepID=A0AA39C5N5_9HYME|nr:hypothetical protein PV328_009361 [Microctonus aethiopoides]
MLVGNRIALRRQDTFLAVHEDYLHGGMVNEESVGDVTGSLKSAASPLTSSTALGSYVSREILDTLDGLESHIEKLRRG